MAFHAVGDKAAANIQMQLFPKLSTCSPPELQYFTSYKRAIIYGGAIRSCSGVKKLTFPEQRR
jgi:hypothetical protein